MSDTDHLKHLLKRSTRAAGPESTGMGEVTIDADKVLDRAGEALRRSSEFEVRQSDDFEKALAIFAEHANITLRAVAQNPTRPLDRQGRAVLEAIIRTDGTRPTLPVRDDAVDPDHPMAGKWRETLIGIGTGLRPVFQAVGRIEPASGSANAYWGTGWVVDQAKGLVITNLHVLHAMAASIPNAMGWNSTTKTYSLLKGAAFIDFGAEDGSVQKKRLQIVEAKPSGIDGPLFARLDAAVLRVETFNGAGALTSVPQAIPITKDLGGPSGALSDFCVVGFPGPPAETHGTSNGVDWTWVTRTLFGNRFGIKRLAPGNAHKALGSVAGDPQSWVFGHDATTLGGSSGSAIVAWNDTQCPAFGLHFAGATLDSNFAHALGNCARQLGAMGVPF